MNVLVLLIPISLGLGIGALCAFVWGLKNGQFEDPKGNAERILNGDEMDQDDDRMDNDDPTPSM